MSVRINFAPASVRRRTMYSAIAPRAPVMRIGVFERSIVIIVHARFLHDSILLKRLDSGAAFFYGLFNHLFSTRFFECADEYFFLCVDRDNQHAVDIAENDLSRM